MMLLIRRWDQSTDYLCYYLCGNPQTERRQGLTLSKQTAIKYIHSPYRTDDTYNIIHTALAYTAVYPGQFKNKLEKTHVEGFSHLRQNLFSVLSLLYGYQCHIKHLKFRCINIMLQALEQDREYIKQRRNDNIYCLLVDESVSPHTE